MRPPPVLLLIFFSAFLPVYASNIPWQSRIVGSTCTPVFQTLATTAFLQFASEFPRGVPTKYVNLLAEWIAFSPPTQFVTCGENCIKLSWFNDTDRVELKVQWNLPQDANPVLTIPDPLHRILQLGSRNTLRSSEPLGQAIYHQVLAETPFHPFSQAYASRLPPDSELIPFEDTVAEAVVPIADVALLRGLLRSLRGWFPWDTDQRLLTRRARHYDHATRNILLRLQLLNALPTGVVTVLGDFLTDAWAKNPPSLRFLRRVLALHRTSGAWNALLGLARDIGIPVQRLEAARQIAQRTDWAQVPRDELDQFEGGRIFLLPLDSQFIEKFSLDRELLEQKIAAVQRWFDANPRRPLDAGRPPVVPGSAREVAQILNFYVRSNLDLDARFLPTTEQMGWSPPAPPTEYRRAFGAYFLFRLPAETRGRLVALGWISTDILRNLEASFFLADPAQQVRPAPAAANPQPPRMDPPAPIVSPPPEFALPRQLPAPNRRLVTDTMRLADGLETGVLPTLQWIHRVRQRMLAGRHPIRRNEQEVFQRELAHILRPIWQRNGRRADSVDTLLALVSSSFTPDELAALEFLGGTAAITPLTWPTVSTEGLSTSGHEPERAAIYSELIQWSYARAQRLLDGWDSGEASAHTELQELMLHWISGQTVSMSNRESAGIWMATQWILRMPRDLRRRLWPLGGSLMNPIPREPRAAMPQPAASPRPPVPVISPQAEADMIRIALEKLLFQPHLMNGVHIAQSRPRIPTRPPGEPGPMTNPAAILREGIAMEAPISVSTPQQREFTLQIDDYAYTFGTSTGASAALALTSPHQVAIHLVRITYQPAENFAGERRERPSNPEGDASTRRSRPEPVVRPPLLSEIPGAPYRVEYSPQVRRRYERDGRRGFPDDVARMLVLLAEDLMRIGPILLEWKNFSRFGADMALLHAHLQRRGSGGNSYWVAAWRVVRNSDGQSTIVITHVFERDRLSRALTN